MSKRNPTGMQVTINKNWQSQWIANKDYAKFLHEDFQIRQYLQKSLSHASVSKIEIDRVAEQTNITIHSARPGIIIGREGADLDKLRLGLKKLSIQASAINIKEITQPNLDATLVAQNITKQIEKRLTVARAAKKTIAKTMDSGALGIQVYISGRINGVDIARTEWYREGVVPMQNFKADIDYGFVEAHTTYGLIGVKTWINRPLTKEDTE